MAKTQVTRIVPTSHALFFDKIAFLDVRKECDEHIEWYERLPYVVNVNMMQIAFQYDPETRKFYVDHNDEASMDKQLEEHQKMEADGQDIKDLYVQYLERHEYVLTTTWDSLASRVDKLIESISIS